jgi:hypothetical protein
VSTPPIALLSSYLRPTSHPAEFHFCSVNSGIERVTEKTKLRHEQLPILKKHHPFTFRLIDSSQFHLQSSVASLPCQPPSWNTTVPSPSQEIAFGKFPTALPLLQHRLTTLTALKHRVCTLVEYDKMIADPVKSEPESPGRPHTQPCNPFIVPSSSFSDSRANTSEPQWKQCSTRTRVKQVQINEAAAKHSREFLENASKILREYRDKLTSCDIRL